MPHFSHYHENKKRHASFTLDYQTIANSNYSPQIAWNHGSDTPSSHTSSILALRNPKKAAHKYYIIQHTASLYPIKKNLSSYRFLVRAAYSGHPHNRADGSAGRFEPLRGVHGEHRRALAVDDDVHQDAAEPAGQPVDPGGARQRLQQVLLQVVQGSGAQADLRGENRAEGPKELLDADRGWRRAH